MMTVTPGSTDVTTYFSLRLLTNGTEATGLTITDLDLQYVRSGVAPAAKVDATALAATDSAHSDNKAIEIDSTDQPGLYRVDWPDAAFAAGVREVILSVKHTSCFTEHLRVTLETLQTGDSYARLGAPAGASIAADLVTIDDFLDTEIAAIKAKTDNLPADPADASDIAALIDAVPTATENADALLNRDMSAVSDTNSRSPLNALRLLRNKWTSSGGTLTVAKEDDTTAAWTGSLTTDAAAEPITGNDPS